MCRSVWCGAGGAPCRPGCSPAPGGAATGAGRRGPAAGGAAAPGAPAPHARPSPPPRRDTEPPAPLPRHPVAGRLREQRPQRYETEQLQDERRPAQQGAGTVQTRRFRQKTGRLGVERPTDRLRFPAEGDGCRVQGQDGGPQRGAGQPGIGRDAQRHGRHEHHEEQGSRDQCRQGQPPQQLPSGQPGLGHAAAQPRQFTRGHQEDDRGDAEQQPQGGAQQPLGNRADPTGLDPARRCSSGRDGGLGGLGRPGRLGRFGRLGGLGRFGSPGSLGGLNGLSGLSRLSSPSRLGRLGAPRGRGVVVDRVGLRPGRHPGVTVPGPPDDHREGVRLQGLPLVPRAPYEQRDRVLPRRLLRGAVLVRRPPRPARAVPGGRVQPGPPGAVGGVGSALAAGPHTGTVGRSGACGMPGPGPAAVAAPQDRAQPGNAADGDHGHTAQHRPPGAGDPGRREQQRRAAQDEDAHGALHRGEHAGAPLDAEHADVQLDHDARQRPEGQQPQHRGTVLGVVLVEGRQDLRGEDDQHQDDRHQQQRHAAQRPADAVGEAARVVRGVGGEGGGHVDGHELHGAADGVGDVEVAVLRGGEVDRDHHRQQVDHREAEERPQRVPGQEAPHLADLGRLHVVVGGGLARDEAPEDQPAERQRGEGDGHGPGDEDAEHRQRGGEDGEQDQLADREHRVPGGHPLRLAQPGQHTVLEGEQRPGHAGRDEQGARPRRAQRGVRRAPQVEGEQEDDGGQRDDHRTGRVRAPHQPPVARPARGTKRTTAPIIVVAVMLASSRIAAMAAEPCPTASSE